MSFPAIFPNHQLPWHHPLGPEAPQPRPTPSSAPGSKMAPRACVMTRPSVRRKCAQRLQGTGGLGVWYPELRELGGAAPRWSRRAAATMVFYFTSSGEWAPRAPGPLLHAVFRSRDPRPSRSLDLVGKRLLRGGCLCPRRPGPLCCSSLWSPSPSECPLLRAGGARRDPPPHWTPLRSSHPECSRDDLPSLPGIGQFGASLHLISRPTNHRHYPWPLVWLCPGHYAL